MLKTLATVNWIIEADALCAQLRANGIEAIIPDQGTVAIQPLYANAIGGIRVQVGESDLERAKDFLNEQQQTSSAGTLAQSVQRWQLDK